MNTERGEFMRAPSYPWLTLLPFWLILGGGRWLGVRLNCFALSAKGEANGNFQ